MEENLRLSKSFFSSSSYNIEKRFLLEYILSKSNNKIYHKTCSNPPSLWLKLKRRTTKNTRKYKREKMYFM